MIQVMKTIDIKIIQLNLNKSGFKIIGKYKNTHTPVLAKCTNNHITSIFYHNKIKGEICEKCYFNKRKQEYTQYQKNTIKQNHKKCLKCKKILHISQYYKNIKKN